jgi:hypothetical protein
MTAPEPEVMVAPERAHTIICKMGGDTARDLAHELRHLADQIDRGQLTVGCGGGPSGGGIWSYRVAPEQTHDVYFQQVAAWLAEKRRREGDAA